MKSLVRISSRVRVQPRPWRFLLTPVNQALINWGRLTGLVLAVSSTAFSQCFQRTDYETGNQPQSVTVGDVNGDGRLDLITANPFILNSIGNVAVLRSTASGGFERTEYEAGTWPFSVAVGDVNGDGRLDLIAANADSDNVTVLRGNADGGFDPTNYEVGDGPESVAVGDVNRDGRLDLITTNANSRNVTILRGTANGNFQRTDYNGVGGSPRSVKVGDVNGDGRLDLIMVNAFGYSNNVTVLRGIASGGFERTNYKVGNFPVSLALADVNEDGRLDLVTANRNGASVTVLRGNGSGGFDRTDYGVGDTPFSVAIGDLNRDGRLDLITANLNSDNVTVLKGTASRGFERTDYNGVGNGPQSVTLGDMNGDGRLDLLVANVSSTSVAVLLNQASPTFTATDVTICSGQSVNLATTVSGQIPTGGTLSYYASLTDAQTGQNPLPSPTVSPTNATTYFIRYQLSGNESCSTIEAVRVAVSNTNLPAPSLTPSALSTTNQPISVTATGCTGTVNWLSQGGTGSANGSVYTFTQPGSYTLSATCSVSSCTSPAANALPLSIQSGGDFAITTVTMVNCQTVNQTNGEHRVSFTPLYSGSNSQPIRFSVVNELAPTTALAPYTLRLYADNPVVTLVANQTGHSEARYRYDWLAACSSGTSPNRVPTTSGIASQTSLQGQPYQLALTNYFSDPDGQQLTFSASGLPAGLELSGSLISGSASSTGVSMVSITARDPGGLSVGTGFSLRVIAGPITPSGFTIVGVSVVNCEVMSAAARRLSFLPQYAGTSGQPISFSVVNELAPTTHPGPYSLRLYTDNPTITLKATQHGTAGEAALSYNWLVACTSSSGARLEAEPVVALQVQVLGNPVSNVIEVEVAGAEGSALNLILTDVQGRTLHQHSVERATHSEKIRFTISNGPVGILLLRATTPTQSQTIRMLKWN